MDATLKLLDIYTSKTGLLGTVVKGENVSDFYEWQQHLGGYMKESVSRWLQKAPDKKWLTVLLTFNGIVKTV